MFRPSVYGRKGALLLAAKVLWHGLFVASMGASMVRDTRCPRILPHRQSKARPIIKKRGITSRYHYPSVSCLSGEVLDKVAGYILPSLFQYLGLGSWGQTSKLQRFSTETLTKGYAPHLMTTGNPKPMNVTPRGSLSAYSHSSNKDLPLAEFSNNRRAGL